jgi:transmembrane sensor
LDELIIRFLRGEAEPAEHARLSTWRGASQENERKFQEVAAIWRATAPNSSAARPSAGILIERAERRRTSSWPLRVAALAAMLLLGLALGELRPAGESTSALGMGEFVTGATEMATARLSDGTVVRLAPRSRLRVTDRRDAREVWLDGKAFFAVQASEDHPFLVRTRAGEAHVLGTRFEVEVRDDDLRVVVVEGRVDLGARESRVALTAGQVARSVGGGAPTVIEHDNVAGLIDWMGAFLAFESTPLHRVAEELERRFDVEVLIQDPSLRDRTVTAWFGEQDVESVLAVICRIADAHCSVRDGVASIEP